MSYTVYDAWLEEKATGDWPFQRWRLSAPRVRNDREYFAGILRLHAEEPVSALAYRALSAFGTPDLERLQVLLSETAKVVECAVEHAETEAYECWLRHEVWYSKLDDRLDRVDSVAQLVVQCLEAVGPTEGASEQEICAAVAIWCLGEWAHFKDVGDHVGKAAAVVQTAIALCEADYWRGFNDRAASEKRDLADRNKKAADARHRANRERKENALRIWSSRDWRIQADAERAIADQCCITKDVAGRWIREFKNAIRGGR